jgi:hypothetical protein
MRIALRIVALAAAALASTGLAEIIDRILAVVGRDIVTLSDVEREAQLEAFFRGAPPAPEHAGGAEGPAIMERLIRQRLVRQEMEQTTFPPAEDGQVREWLARMGPAGADPSQYGLLAEDLYDYARRQIDIERFIDLRFRPGIQASPEEVEAYYERVLLPELQRRGIAERPTLEEAGPQIEQVLMEERLNVLVDQWLAEARAEAGVRLLQPEQSMRP